MKKFDAIQWENFHNHDRRKLVCAPCRDSHTERLKRLKRLVERPGAWRCKCGFKIHASKCPLYPTFYREQRWPGKKKPGEKEGVLLEDKLFLDKHRPEWWLKRLGPR